FIAESEIPDMIAQVRELQPIGSESRIGSNLRTVLNDLRGTPPSSVILVTDGVTTAGEPLPQAALYAQRKGIPVFTIGVGNPDQQRDIEIHDLLVDEAVFVDDIVPFEAKLSARGFEGRTLTVALKQKGLEEELDRQTYQVPADGQPVKVRLSHR